MVIVAGVQRGSPCAAKTNINSYKLVSRVGAQQQSTNYS